MLGDAGFASSTVRPRENTFSRTANKQHKDHSGSAHISSSLRMSCRNLTKTSLVLDSFRDRDRMVFGILSPGFLNQVPTLVLLWAGPTSR